MGFFRGFCVPGAFVFACGFAAEVCAVSAEFFGIDGFIHLYPGFELVVGRDDAGSFCHGCFDFVLQEMEGVLCAAGGDDGEGEVAEDVKAGLAEFVFCGYAVFVPGDPFCGEGVKVGVGCVILCMPAVEGGVTDCGDVGDFVGEAHPMDEGVEGLILVVGEEDVEVFSGAGLFCHGRAGADTEVCMPHTSCLIPMPEVEGRGVLSGARECGLSVFFCVFFDQVVDRLLSSHTIFIL